MRLAAIAVLLALGPSARAAERHAMAVYHFNVQYVAGGVRGFPDGNNTDPQFDLDEKQTEDAIVVESFEPLLDIYLRHPAWGADFELQGDMIDIIRERHPRVLAKLRTLSDRAQISLDSFHWSDQLWLAYPRRDQEMSWELTKKSFAAAGLPLGKAVWTQEGQWAPGVARFMKERALEVAILPRNLFKHYAPDVPIGPIYKLGDVLCVVTQGASNDEVESSWIFADDGELTVTGRKNPYLGKLFVKSAEEIAKYEDELVKLEAAGWKQSTAAAYAKRAVELGVPTPELPTVLDGAWQPKDTDNLFRWMGGAGLLNPIGAEADNAVLAGNARAAQLVRTLESQLPQLVADGVEVPEGENFASLDALTEQAWREVLLAQVSDASGWNPFVGERLYAERHAAEAVRLVESVLGPREPATEEPRKEVEPLVPVTLVASKDRGAVAKWTKRTENVYELELAFGATDGDRPVSASFPRTTPKVITTLALEDDTVREFDRAALAPELLSLGLPIGFVGLADDLFLIQRMDSVHLAALLPKSESVVRFTDETAPREAFTWRFVVVKGSKSDALAEAHRLNVDPVEWPSSGCGCDAGGASLLAFLPLLSLVRRRALVRS